jgi:glycosyltransferase involved in cell wall biosynthesis
MTRPLPLLWGKGSACEAPGRRLALFLPTLGGGGAERAMLNLSQGLAERGCQVDLVVQRSSGPFRSQVPDVVRLVDLHAKRMATAVLPLAIYLRRARPHALLSAMTHANIVAILAGKLARVRTRIVISERSTLSIASRNATRLLGRLMPVARLLYPRADAIVAVSEGVADDLASILCLPRSRIQVIYNPVAIAQLWDKARETLDHPWFRDGEPPVVISVGRLTKAKDFPTLISALALVQKKLSARLIILGEGEERRELEDLVCRLRLESVVEMPGFVDNPHKYVRRASVFVLSSRWEGLPNALIEALVLGTPVVSTDCPSGPAEILQAGTWGRLVPVGDRSAMAEAIRDVLEHGGQADETARSAFVMAHFSSESVARAYLAVCFAGAKGE